MHRCRVLSFALAGLSCESELCRRARKRGTP